MHIHLLGICPAEEVPVLLPLVAILVDERERECLYFSTSPYMSCGAHKLDKNQGQLVHTFGTSYRSSNEPYMIQWQHRQDPVAGGGTTMPFLFTNHFGAGGYLNPRPPTSVGSQYL
ncbi:hypothetical protein LguiA_018926 [Lonicera macranthoides]